MRLFWENKNCPHHYVSCSAHVIIYLVPLLVMMTTLKHKLALWFEKQNVLDVLVPYLHWHILVTFITVFVDIPWLICNIWCPSLWFHVDCPLQMWTLDIYLHAALELYSSYWCWMTIPSWIVFIILTIDIIEPFRFSDISHISLITN